MRLVFLVCLFAFLAAACSSCGGMSAERKQAIAKAEATCAVEAATKYALAREAAKAQGQSVPVSTTIQIVVEEIICAYHARGAQPPPKSEIGAAAGSAIVVDGGTP
jgi:hypothetical protein